MSKDLKWIANRVKANIYKHLIRYIKFKKTKKNVYYGQHEYLIFAVPNFGVKIA